MAGDKKQSRISIRFDEQLFRVAADMQKEHGADDISDYIRGLIVLQAVQEGRSIRGVQIPGWISELILHTVRETGRQQEDPKARAARR